jgi:hypothetical protein
MIGFFAGVGGSVLIIHQKIGGKNPLLSVAKALGAVGLPFAGLEIAKIFNSNLS